MTDPLENRADHRVTAAVVAVGTHHFGDPGWSHDTLAAVRSALGVDGLELRVRDATDGAMRPSAAVGRTDPDAARLDLVIGTDTVGTLGVTGTCPAVHALGPLAVALALAVRGRQLFEGVQSRARDLDREVRLLMALEQIAAAVTRTESIRDVAAVVAMQVRRLVHATDAGVIAATEEGGTLTLGVEGRIKPVAVTAAVAAMRSGQHQLVPGPVLALPVTIDADAPAALVVTRDGSAFSADDVEHLTVLGQQAAIAFANARLLGDLRREQDRRQQIAAALVTAQERERQRIAEDIHDGPVQELVGLGLLLDALAQSSTPADGDDARLPLEAARRARAVIGTLRQAIFDLHPMSIQKLGFSSAVRAVLDRIEPGTLRTQMSDLELADALPETTRTLAFRVVQEAIANSTRHANADLVTVFAARVDGLLHIGVTDDGIGFDPDRIPDRTAEGRLGLEAMRQRALLAGATLEISSRAGRTCVEMIFPDVGPDDAPQAISR